MLSNLRRRLRPMGFSDILDEAVDLYRSNFVLLFEIGAVLYLPLSLLQTYFGLDEAVAFRQEELDAARAAGRLTAIALIAGVEGVLITGAMTIATAQTYLERKTSVWECYKQVIHPRTLLSFIWANILFFGLVGMSLALPVSVLVGAGVLFANGSAVAGLFLLLVGLAAFLLPIYVGARLAVFTPAFFVERSGAWSSIARSWGLLKGRAVSTFAMVLVVSVVIVLIQSIALSPFVIILGRNQASGVETSPSAIAVHSLLRSGLSALLAPISAMVIILIYYDARIRREGFDLEMLAADLDKSLPTLRRFCCAPRRETARLGPRRLRERFDSGANLDVISRVLLPTLGAVLLVSLVCAAPQIQPLRSHVSASKTVSIKVDSEAVEAHIKDILSAPEYNRVFHKRKSLWTVAIEYLARKLRGFSRWLLESLGFARPGSKLALATAWVLAALLVTVTVAVAARLLLSFRAARAPSNADEEALGIPSSIRLLAEAESLAAGHNYKGAFIRAYLASIARLDELDAVRFERSRTNWEYLRELQAKGFVSVADDLRMLTSLFDRKLYGSESCSRSDYDAAIAAYERVNERLAAA